MSVARGWLEVWLEVWLEAKLQIARGLKASGMELEQIAIITGLTLQELEGL